MKKVFIFGLLLLIVIVFALLWWKSSSSSTITPVDTVVSEQTPTKTPVVLASWKDPVGFTFQYPQSSSINKHDEDKDNYAHIELTDAAHPGNLIVWLKDVPKTNGKTITDLGKWVENEKMFAGGTVIDTMLGGTAGIKILLTGETRTQYILVLYDDLLYELEAHAGNDMYWMDAMSTAVDSFVLHSPVGAEASSAQPASSALDNSVVDEEEVIE